MTQTTDGPAVVDATGHGLLDDVETPEQQAAWDALDALTLAELDAGSRLLKASLVKAMSETTVDYERAVVVLAYLHARRADRETKPAELLRRFEQMRYSEVTAYLLDLAPKLDEGGDPDADPTGPGPA